MCRLQEACDYRPLCVIPSPVILLILIKSKRYLLFFWLKLSR
ncbi:hypothetical protein CSC18_0604 [Klebsiella aerogenes]|nr:hypothetical protein CSC18_0604 [Klebsiella aerogenes]